MSAQWPRRFFSHQNIPRLAIIFVVLVYIGTNFSHHKWTRDKGPNRGVISWDIISYYAYLPAVFIYGDLSLDFTDEPGFVNDNKFWFAAAPTGKKLIITSMGMSFLYTPFFMMAHLLAPVFGEPRSGFNSIYQFFLVFSSLFYAGMGLLFLRRILLRYVNPPVAGITLLLIGLGTNLYYYATFEAAMTHSYNFCLITLFLFLVIQWYEKISIKRSFFLGLVFGMVTLVRPTNILVLILFLLWEVNTIKGLKTRFIFLLSGNRYILIMLAGSLLVWIPQFLYWKEITGQFIYYSYAAVDSRFFFGAPHITELLFSFRKGWLLYTPVMVFALIGLFLPGRKIKGSILPLSLYMLFMIYVQASWWTWWFGGSFGSRIFVDTYGIMALPLAFFIDHTFMNRRKVIFICLPSLLILLMFYQIFQTFQYHNGAIHWEGMTKAAYRENFMRLRPHGRYWQMLSLPDSKLAREGIYVYYLTGEDISLLKGLSKGEGRDYLEQEIRRDRKLMKEIARYAGRSSVSQEEAIRMVTNRMYEEKLSLHGSD